MMRGLINSVRAVGIKGGTLLIWLAAALRMALPAAAETPTTLMLFCGAGVRPAAEALISAFEAQHPKVRVSPTYGGSGQLLGQIGSIRKGDVFMPVEAFYIDRAIEMGVAEVTTQHTIGWFVPVIFTKKDNPHAITKLADLAQPGVRLGVGDERSCAIGITTVALLEQVGSTAEAIRANIVYKSATVDELALAVRLGTVDAVIVWEAVARYYTRFGVIVPLAEGVKHAAEISIVRLKSTNSPAAADAFIDFVVAPEGQALLAKLGYGPPAKPTPAGSQPKKKEKVE
ncbi:MAG: molybdate ABC transporter substrate-binding protein [Kiritimatiellae bacterium]|nr:molybdate ABC transporter substrate-binding protein [Kiritimatiellia bacterium]